MAASPRRVTLSPTAGHINGNGNNGNGHNNSPVNNNVAATVTSTTSPGHNTNGALHSPSHNNNGTTNTGGATAPPGGPLVHDKGGNGHHPVTITVVNHGGHARAAAYGQASSHQPVPATPLAISRQNSFDRSILTSGIRLQPPSEKRPDLIGGTTGEGAGGTIRSNKQLGNSSGTSCHRCGTRCLMRQIWWIILVIGVAAAAMTYVFSYRAGRDTWVSNFNHECMERKTYLANALTSELTNLQSMVSLFGSLTANNINTTRGIFESFATPLLDSTGLAIAWYQHVAGNQVDRDNYVAQLRTIYNNTNLTLVALDRSSPTSSLPVSYPLTYTSMNSSDTFPPALSRASLGRDAQVQYATKDWYFLTAIEIGKATSTDMTTSSSSSSSIDPLLVTVYLPVYDTIIPAGSTTTYRRDHAAGFIAASLNFRILLNNLFDVLPDLEGNIEVAANPADGCTTSTSGITKDTQFTATYQRTTTSSVDDSVTNTSTICVANRQWQLKCTPSASKIRTEAGTAPAVYLVAVGVVTLLLAILLHRLVRISLLSRRIDAANQKKSQYLSFVCHEIRNPLHAIVGMNTLLSESGLHPKQLDYCDSIASSAHLMSAIVNDVLDLNKIEAGKLELENVSFDLRSLVSDIEEVYRLIADSKVAWSVSVDEKVPRILVGDPTRLRQMMTNFISNSFKFTRQGSVTLHIGFIKDQGSKVTVAFSVRDTGLGIAADNIPKLFRAYSQAQASILRDFGGTGLGLSIVKSLADAMGGRVQVQSTIGKGSTFSFELTMDKADTDPPSQHHIVSTRQSGLIKTDWREEVKRGVEAARQHTAHEEYVLEMSRSAGALSPMGGAHDSHGGGSTTPNRGFFGGRMRSEYKLGSRAGVYINASRLHELRAPEDSSNSNAAMPSVVAPVNGGTTLHTPNNGTSGTTTAAPTGGTNAAGAPVKWSPPSSPSTQSHAEHKLRLSTSSGMPTPVHAATNNNNANTTVNNNSNGTGSNTSEADTPTAAATNGVVLSAAAAAAASATGDATGSPERLTVITAGLIDNALAAGTPVGNTTTTAITAATGGASGALGELRSPEYRPSSRANPSRFKGSPTPPGVNPDAGSGGSGGHHGHGHGHGGGNAVVSPLPPDILPIRVLLVEDNAVNRKLGLHILARTGLEPDAATDGLDCVHKCNNHQYDLILMDVQMPRMDGIQATQALRSRGLVTPIVALTANAMASERTKCIQAGMDEFVTKPFKPEQLLNVVLERAAVRVPRWSSATFSNGGSSGMSMMGLSTTIGNSTSGSGMMNGGSSMNGTGDHHPLGPSSSADPGDHARPPAVRDETAWLCEQRERRAQVLKALWERERPTRARKLKGAADTKTNGGQAPPPVVSAAVARRAEKRMSSGNGNGSSATANNNPNNNNNSGVLSASVASAAAAAAANAQMMVAAAQAQAAMSLMNSTGTGHSSPAHATSSSPHHHMMTPARRSGGHGSGGIPSSISTPTNGSPATTTLLTNYSDPARASGNLHTMSWERKRSETSPNHATTTISTNGAIGTITTQQATTTLSASSAVTGVGTPTAAAAAAAASGTTVNRTLSPMGATSPTTYAAAVMAYVPQPPPPPPTMNVAASPTPPQHFVLPPPPLGVATAINGASSSSLSTHSGVAGSSGPPGVHPNGHSSATPSSGGGSSSHNHITRSHGDDGGDEGSPPVSDVAPLTAMSPSTDARTLHKPVADSL